MYYYLLLPPDGVDTATLRADAAVVAVLRLIEVSSPGAVTILPSTLLTTLVGGPASGCGVPLEDEVELKLLREVVERGEVSLEVMLRSAEVEVCAWLIGVDCAEACA